MMALGGVTYLDRVCISILAPSIMQDLSLDTIQMSYVFSAFTFAYAIFEMPTAWWADRVGSRKVLTRIVVWWSAFTMVTAGAFNYTSMLAARWLFGMGEAGAWPNVTPVVVAWIATLMPWRWVFIISGFVGLAWAAAFYRWFRDEPRDHASVSPEERDFIESHRMAITHGHGAWHKVFRVPGLLPLCLQYFANNCGFYFFITWLPQYLRSAHGMQDSELAIFAGLPLTLSAVADISGGWTTDWLARRFGVRIGYGLAGGVAYALGAGIMFAGAAASNGQVAGMLIAVAGALSMVTLAPSWATAIALGGENAGLMGAVMNTAGQVGGILCPIVVAYLVKQYGDWSLPIYVLSGIYAAAALCWLFIRPDGGEVHQ
jgi:ACS family glucarate transporter-like MFS transporter